MTFSIPRMQVPSPDALQSAFHQARQRIGGRGRHRAPPSLLSLPRAMTWWRAMKTGATRQWQSAHGPAGTVHHKCRNWWKLQVIRYL